MSSKLIIFDLDDTLVRYGKKRKICVPRQTFHSLRDLHARGFTLVCVTYNCYGEMIANQCCLFKYISFLQYARNIGDRSLVVRLVAQKYNSNNFSYFDDRKDNIEQVKLKFPNSSCIHVSNPLLLHKLIKSVVDES